MPYMCFLILFYFSAICGKVASGSGRCSEKCDAPIHGKCFVEDCNVPEDVNTTCNALPQEYNGPKEQVNYEEGTVTIRFPLLHPKCNFTAYTLSLRYYHNNVSSPHTEVKYITTDGNCSCQEGEATFEYIFTSTYDFTVSVVDDRYSHADYTRTGMVLTTKFPPFSNFTNLSNLFYLTCRQTPVESNGVSKGTVSCVVQDHRAHKACGRYTFILFKNCEEREDIGEINVCAQVPEKNISSELAITTVAFPNVSLGSYCVEFTIEDKRCYNTVLYPNFTCFFKQKPFTIEETKPIPIEQAPSNVAPVVVAGLVILLLVAIIAFCVWQKLHMKFQAPYGSMDQSSLMTANADYPSKILLLYGNDPDPKFSSSMVLLRQWLAEQCQCTILDVHDPDIVHDLSTNSRDWLCEHLEDSSNSTRIIIVCSNETPCNDFRNGLYDWAVNMLMYRNDERKYQSLFAARIEGYDITQGRHSAQHLVPYQCFLLPDHLPKLLAALCNAPTIIELTDARTDELKRALHSLRT